ncbi:MAG: hydroxysqualene dehydroxylase HpnE [Candidatus Binataceae bacterium]
MAVEVKDVVIIGGGFAGLSAAVALSDKGFRVALLEGKPALGGRAYSFTDPETGDFVDNGQHVLMGCYRETLGFLGKIGTRNKLIVQKNLAIEMLDGPGHRAHIATAWLPGPLHMIAALLRYRHLSISDRVKLLRAGARMLRLRRRQGAPLQHATVAELMDTLGQSQRARRCFWYPLAIATLNEDPGLASAGLLAEVMKRAFFGSRFNSSFVYSRVGLSDLYCGAAQKFIESRGGVIACRAIVEGFEFDSGGALAAVRLRDRGRLAASHFIAAVPPAQLLRLLPEAAIADPFFSQLNQLGSSPIICVHVWLDREVTDFAFVGFIGTTTQWLFNKRRIFARHGERHPGYLSFVISGARQLLDKSNEELLALVMEDLRRMISGARDAKLVKALVLREKHATIATDPASDAVRPPSATPITNFYLAGDWIQTGLPATIESAVASGHAAAKLIIRSSGETSSRGAAAAR